MNWAPPEIVRVTKQFSKCEKCGNSWDTFQAAWRQKAVPDWLQGRWEGTSVAERNRDVYIPDPDFYPSRIQQQQQKMRGKISCLTSTFYLEQVQMKSWANDKEKKLSLSASKILVGDPGSGKKPIPDPLPKCQKGTRSRIRIRNTGRYRYSVGIRISIGGGGGGEGATKMHLTVTPR